MGPGQRRARAAPVDVAPTAARTALMRGRNDASFSSSRRAASSARRVLSTRSSRRASHTALRAAIDESSASSRDDEAAGAGASATKRTDAEEIKASNVAASTSSGAERDIQDSMTLAVFSFLFLALSCARKVVE